MRKRVVEIAATVRSEVSKSATKRLRAAGQVPGVLYGRGKEPTPLVVDESEFRRALPEPAWYATPLHLKITGGEPAEAMIAEVQQDTIRRRIIAIDFHAISANEPVRVHVPVRVTGESAAVKQGGVVEVLLHEVPVEALPGDLPDHLEADISRLDFHDHLRVGDLEAPPGVKVLAPREEAVVVITPPHVVVEAAPEAAVEAEAEEPEVLPKQETSGQETTRE